MHDLHRFIKAHEKSYETAFAEIHNGRKLSHWMWYIFPQLRGLGMSETSQFYGIKNLDEAQAFLDHPILGQQLREISNELLLLDTNNPTAVFGKPDDMKLHSSMTLFASVPSTAEVFQEVLDKFFGGEKDPKTAELIGA
jgi:uncharacterized protein (DUF1810 family)